MGCYKDFAHIYDELIHEDVNYSKWSKVILKICEEVGMPKEAYLDLACGTGNLTKELAQGFQTTWGVDLSSEMLTEAESKMRECGIKAKLICQNICNLDLKKTFDLITCGLDSTNYILEEEELENYFKGVHKHLKNDGLFIFDINSYYKLTEILGDTTYHFMGDEVVYIWENSIENEVVNMFLTFFVKEGELYTRFEEEHCERAYKESTIELKLQQIGFKILKKLDNYEYKSIKEDTERIVYVVQKV